MTHSRGVTLIETVIAVALVALLIILGFPAFQGMIASSRVRAVGESILGGLQVARVEAMKRNQTITFNIDGAVGGGWSVILDADQSILMSKEASAGGTVQVAGDLGMQARFNNLGLRTEPMGGDLVFSITDPYTDACQPAGNVRCVNVVVRPGGQFRLCDPNRPAGDPQACVFN